MRPRRVTALSALALASLSCGAPAPVDPREGPGVFVAFDPDFAGYRAWAQHDLGAAAPLGHPAGRQVLYVSAPLAPGAARYADRTIIVREIQADPDRTKWDLFAMVRRGGGYNQSGAIDWEFFILSLDATGAPHVVSRGISPAETGASPYHPGEGITCNTCHGNEDARRGDCVLSAEIRPQVP
jgi:hypothetical protein